MVQAFKKRRMAEDVAYILSDSPNRFDRLAIHAGLPHFSCIENKNSILLFTPYFAFYSCFKKCSTILNKM